MSVYVAIPSYRGHEGYYKFTNMLLFLQKDMPKDTFFRLDCVKGGVCRALNTFTDEFLENERLEWFLRLDDDELVNAEAIMAMTKLGSPVVSGLVPRLNFPHNPPIGDWCTDGKPRNLIDFSWTKPFEVDWCGGGFMLIHKSIFRQLEKPYWSKKQAPFMGEDIHFCEKLKEMGVRVMVDPRAQAAHLKGRYLITMQDFKNAYRKGQVWRWDEDSAYYPR